MFLIGAPVNAEHQDNQQLARRSKAPRVIPRTVCGSDPGEDLIEIVGGRQLPGHGLLKRTAVRPLRSHLLITAGHILSELLKIGQKGPAEDQHQRQNASDTDRIREQQRQSTRQAARGKPVDQWPRTVAATTSDRTNSSTATRNSQKARRWSELLGGAQVYLKREDLNHTGAHKINNTIGQALLARRMGKPRVIAETGAGQHGVATATVAARFGMECVVYMGSEDVERQAANVYRMKLLGATVVPVDSGSRTLKDALNEAMRDWVTNVENTFYIIGTVAGPHPYPMMVRDFNSVVGKECIEQMPRDGRPAAGRGDRLRRRRQQRDGHLLRLHPARAGRA